MKILLLTLAAAICLAAIVLAIGYLLPVNHRVSRSVLLQALPKDVWKSISDFKGAASWRSLKSVEQVELQPRSFAWKEVDQGGDVLVYLTLEALPEQRLVRKIVDDGLPFGGTWTFELAGEGTGTRLSITEDGRVYNPVFRFMSRFVFGHYASLDKYLGQLIKHLGEK